MFWIKALLLSTLLALGVIASWALTDTALHLTSTSEFCGSCHSMKPMQSSFLRDPHGGNSTTGIQALCTDCHLPHNSTVDYLWMKARNGAWDVWKEFVLGADDVDWHAKRARANEYVYDSGCLKCHNNLQAGSEQDHAQFVAHKPYFLGTIEDSCIDCHRVGHTGLTQDLPPPPIVALSE